MDYSDNDNAGLYRNSEWVAHIKDRGYFRVLSELSTRGFLQGLSSECPSITPILEGLTEKWPTLARMSAEDRYASLCSEIEAIANPKELAVSTSWKYVLYDRIKTQHKDRSDALRAAVDLQRDAVRTHNRLIDLQKPPSPKKRNNNAKRKRTIDTQLEEYKEEIREQLEDLSPQLQLRLLRSLVREYNNKKKEKKE